MWGRLSDSCFQIGMRRSILAEGVSRYCIYDPHSVGQILGTLKVLYMENFLKKSRYQEIFPKKLSVILGTILWTTQGQE